MIVSIVVSSFAKAMETGRVAKLESGLPLSGATICKYSILRCHCSCQAARRHIPLDRLTLTSSMAGRRIAGCGLLAVRKPCFLEVKLPHFKGDPLPLQLNLLPLQLELLPLKLDLLQFDIQLLFLEVVPMESLSARCLSKPYSSGSVTFQLH